MIVKPTFKEERKLYRQGYRRIVGVDEVGRGCLAGNVTAAAVTFPAKMPRSARVRKFLKEIRDSKKLTPKKREEIFEALKSFPEITWKIARVSEKVIDRINIQKATELAMVRAVKKFHPLPDFAILDGSRFFSRGLETIQYKLIVKADERVTSSALASVIAKVTRDRLMVRLAKKYPEYRFEIHKGYGTRKHRQALKKFGACELHRKTFRPVALVNN